MLMEILSVTGCYLLSRLSTFRIGIVSPSSGSSSQRRFVYLVVLFSEKLVTVYHLDTVYHPRRLESFSLH
jgi:hypothetical protein